MDLVGGDPQDWDRAPSFVPRKAGLLFLDGLTLAGVSVAYVVSRWPFYGLWMLGFGVLFIFSALATE